MSKSQKKKGKKTKNNLLEVLTESSGVTATEPFYECSICPDDSPNPLRHPTIPESKLLQLFLAPKEISP
jgi:hypothetical protein